MNKLHVLKKLNDDGLFAGLTGEELRLFLLMIANSTEHGEGEILLDRIRWIFGEAFTSERLVEICGSLERKRLVRITCRSNQGNERSVAYRILLPEQSGQAETAP